MIFKKVVVSAARVKRSETLDHDFEFEMKLRLEVAWVIRRQQKEGNAKQHVQLCGNGACAAYSRQLAAAAGENGA